MNNLLSSKWMMTIFNIYSGDTIMKSKEYSKGKHTSTQGWISGEFGDMKMTTNKRIYHRIQKSITNQMVETFTPASSFNYLT